MAESQSVKRRRYYQRSIERHYGGELAGLAHNQLFSQRGLRGTTLGPANRGRRLNAAERQAIEAKLKDEGRLFWGARARSISAGSVVRFFSQ